MGVFTRPDSPFYWMWLEGQPNDRARINTKVPIGATPALKKANRILAEQIYSALMGDLARDRFQLPTDRERRTFLEHRDWYAAHVTSKKRGKMKELSMLRKLGAYFDPYHLDEVDRDVVREWKTWRCESVSEATVNREDEVLKHMLNEAVPKYLEENPIAGMSRLRPGDVDTIILTHDEERRLLKAAAGSRLETAMILCGLDALMRRGSVAGLAPAQNHGSYLTLLDAKAGMYKVPVSNRARRALEALTISRDRRDAKYFDAWRPRIDVEISRHFTALCQRAGILTGRKAGGVTFHSLRHTGATWMLAAGVDIKTVMKIGGWKNLKTLERYLHPTDAVSQAAVNAIASRRRPTAAPDSRRTHTTRRSSRKSRQTA